MKPVVVFELDHFTLETTQGLTNKKDDKRLVMKHACQHRMVGGTPLTVSKVYVYPVPTGVCWRCNATMPNEIRGLYLMHEWDKL